MIRAEVQQEDVLINLRLNDVRNVWVEENPIENVKPRSVNVKGGESILDALKRVYPGAAISVSYEYGSV